MATTASASSRQATIIITTRNRRELARQAIESAIKQLGDNEIILVDDGSTDGTSKYLRELFPTVQVHRYERQEGLVVQRSRAAENASGRVLISLDDDAIFTQPDIVQDTLKMFDHPRVGAVAIPFVNHVQGVDQPMLEDPPDVSRIWVRPTFVGTAYAVRRDVFLRLKGFEGRLFHWAEEQEFCQRMLGLGFVVAAGRSGLIRHFPAGAGNHSPKVNRYITRNHLLIPWLNAPARFVLPLLAMRSAQAIAISVRHPSQAGVALPGLAMGYGAIFQTLLARRPLQPEVYRLWQELRGRHLMPMDEIEPRLPKMGLESDAPRAAII